MSVKKALRFYKGLSKDQQRFINEKKISITLPIREWVAFLKNAALYDEIGDDARKKNRTKIIISVVTIIASIFITTWIPLVGIFIIVIAVLVMAEAIRVNSKLVHLDLTNHLRLFLMPLLYILVEKSGDKADLALTLDLRNPVKKDPTRRYKELENDIKFYDPKYIIAKIKLLDETTMEFIVSDDIRAMRIVKHSFSGKTKIKHKDKVARFYFIRLVFPKKYYRVKNDATTSVRLEETSDNIVCKLKAKAKSQKIDEIISVDEFLKSVEELYNLVEVIPGVQLPAKVNMAPVDNPPQPETADANMVQDTTTMVPFMVWGGSYFGMSDYSGFTRTSGYYSDSSTRDTFLDS